MAELTVVRGNGAALSSLPLFYGATNKLTLLRYGWLKQKIPCCATDGSNKILSVVASTSCGYNPTRLLRQDQT
jgi:hypothetical protein